MIKMRYIRRAWHCYKPVRRSLSPERYLGALNAAHSSSPLLYVFVYETPWLEFGEVLRRHRSGLMEVLCLC